MSTTVAYEYFYCTKSNHFHYVIDKVLDKGVNLETSSAYDLEMIELLIERGRITKNSTILCNGFKDERYIKGIGKARQPRLQRRADHRQHGRDLPPWMR
jgi:arginine decarboxylase-like protein